MFQENIQKVRIQPTTEIGQHEKMRFLIFSSIVFAAVSARISNSTNYYAHSYSSTENQCNDVLTVLENKGLTTLLNLLTEIGLAQTVSELESFTIFAPTNEAFDAIDSKVLQTILNNPDLLWQIIAYHIVPIEASPTTLSALLFEFNVPTFKFEIPMRHNVYRKKGSSVVSSEVITANGVLILDAVQVCNGYVHIIQKVLNPRDMAPDNTEIEVLKNNGFTTLLKFYEVLGLIPNVNIRLFRPETVLAPTDEAFAALPPGVLASLFANKKALLTVLENHYFSGTFYTHGLVSGPLRALSGIDVEVEMIPGGAMFANANVVLPDLTNAQGVIHGINKVILGQLEYLLTSTQKYKIDCQ